MLQCWCGVIDKWQSVGVVLLTSVEVSECLCVVCQSVELRSDEWFSDVASGNILLNSWEGIGNRPEARTAEGASSLMAWWSM